MNRATLHLGDCLSVLRSLDAESIDAIVTDPPYGIAFMGKAWDISVPGVDVWSECLRVLKPGGHLLAFAGTRTQHRLATRIEDAGFEIRDLVAWVYGSGFPKSLDVAKAIDKADGFWRRRSDGPVSSNGSMSGPNYARTPKGMPITHDARRWDGWGTALKPAMEPITVARKPLAGTVAENVTTYGTGALNVDGCRVQHVSESDRALATPQGRVTGKPGALAGKTQHNGGRSEFERPDTSMGRWPANLIHDGSDEVVALFPDGEFGDSGSAARFFYCPKTAKEERNRGCSSLPVRQTIGGGGFNNPMSSAYGSEKAPARNHHPTVKPVDLMRYLCRLVTPPRGVVLDPFAGSGSTGVAAIAEGFRFVGVELSPEYFEIATARIRDAEREAATFLPFAEVGA